MVDKKLGFAFSGSLLDGWQVYDLCYPKIQDLARKGLDDMLAPRPETEDA